MLMVFFLFLIFVVLPVWLVILAIGSIAKSRRTNSEYEKRARREMAITGETREEWGKRMLDRSLERLRSINAARRDKEREEAERESRRILEEFQAYKAKKRG
jgi:hypothetical protein